MWLLWQPFVFSVTKIAIREARLKEIRQEILNSTKLQAHLADNPKDAKVIFGPLKSALCAK